MMVGTRDELDLLAGAVGAVAGAAFSYVSLEQRVPSCHPLREVRKVTDVVLHTLSPELDALYAEAGQPSIAPSGMDITTRLGMLP